MLLWWLSTTSARQCIRKYSDSLTKVECSRNLQAGALAKVIHSRDAERVAALLCDVGDLVVCVGHCARRVTLQPGLSSHFLPFDRVSFDGHRTITVWRWPAQSDGWIGLVPYHSVDGGIGWVLSWCWWENQNKIQTRRHLSCYWLYFILLSPSMPLFI